MERERGAIDDGVSRNICIMADQERDGREGKGREDEKILAIIVFVGTAEMAEGPTRVRAGIAYGARGSDEGGQRDPD